MKTHKKYVIFAFVALGCLIFLIYLLIFPLGFLSDHYYCYSKSFNRVIGVITGSKFDRRFIDTPFTVLGEINIPQITIFTIIFIAFVVFAVLFVIEIKRENVFRPSKAERLQAQIDELQKQVDELKKGE